MNGNPRVPASPGGRSDASTVMGAGCAQNFVARERQEADHRPIAPSIWGMSVKMARCLVAIARTIVKSDHPCSIAGLGGVDVRYARARSIKQSRSALCQSYNFQ